MKAPVESRSLRSKGGGRRSRPMAQLWADVRRHPALVFFLVGYVAIFAVAWWWHFFSLASEQGSGGDVLPMAGQEQVGGLPLGAGLEIGRGRQLLSPRAGAIFGTDQFGVAVLTRVMRGAVETLSAALVGSALAVTLGFLMTVAAGWLAGRRGYAGLSALISGFALIPVVLVAWWLSIALQPGFNSVILVIGISGAFPVIPRLAEVFATLDRAGHVVAARTTGLGRWAILRGEIFPFVWQHLVAYGAMLLPGAVLLETALTFAGFGLGVASPDSWGRLIADGHSLMLEAPWLLIAPGLVIAVTVGWLSLTARSIRKVTHEKDFLSLV